MSSLKPLRIVSGRCVPVLGDDTDTDRIIPARFLKCVTFDGLGEHLFQDERFDTDGKKKSHPLNDTRFSEAEILLGGSNFGCGSSREHAPQAMYRFGIRAIVAVSFAEIFFGNSTTLGLPCFQAAASDIQRLATAVTNTPENNMTLDLRNLTLKFAEMTVSVSLPEGTQSAFLAGRWDPIADLLEGTSTVDETASSLSYLRD
jgi:3-isopropylmalate/(R)-2-methylmalate dehydratase small subunit